MNYPRVFTDNVRNFLDESARIEGYDISKSFLDNTETTVRNNGDAAFLYLMDKCLLTKGVLNEQDFLKTHQILMKDLLPKVDSGHYRTCGVRVSNYIAPKPEFIPMMMMSFIEEFNKREKSTYDTHVEFENIHPFRDGNGRIGRLLWAYDLTRRGEQITPILDLFAGENFFEKRRAYYNSLNASRAK